MSGYSQRRAFARAAWVARRVIDVAQQRAGPRVARWVIPLARAMTPTTLAHPPEAVTAAASRVVVLRHPNTLVFGAGCVARCADDIVARGLKRAFVVTGPTTRTLAEPLGERLRG